MASLHLPEAAISRVENDFTPVTTRSIPIAITSPIESASKQPLTFGIPLPEGLAGESDGFRLEDGEGHSEPVQTRPLAFWRDRSVKWLLCDVVLDSISKGTSTWRLRQLPEERQAKSGSLRIREAERRVHIETGALACKLSCQAPFLFEEVSVGGKRLFSEEQIRIVLQDKKGRELPARVKALAVEECGPVRVTLRFEGEFNGGGRCRFHGTISFYAETGLVRLQFTIHNPNRARHRGGLWDLGDPGLMLFRSLAIELGLCQLAAGRMSWKAEPQLPPQSAKIGPLELYQDSSGGDNWQSRNHVNRDGKVPCSFRGYRVRTADGLHQGLRASPTIAVGDREEIFTVAVAEFWQQFPKALDVEDECLRISFFPRQFADLHELQGGEQKTHVVWLSINSAQSPVETELDWAHQPACPRATPDWCAASGAIDPFSAMPADRGSRLDQYLEEVITGPNGLLKRREIIDEYGWRHYGEVYADHEAAYYGGPSPVISHFNNQYDVVLGTLLQYLRTGQGDWQAVFAPLARHVYDIDIYHTTHDKASYNGGLFWFTDHYKSAGRSTHRTYSKDNCRPGDSSYGGGPASSHNFTTGLLHYYYLTGDANAKAAVIQLADWVLDMDDGRQNILGLIDDGPTGLASCTSDPVYHGPGRGAANSINACLDAWLASCSRHYVDKAEELIRRCIHPHDEVAGHDLLNVELRWSYPMFLAALARYLKLKAEIQETDFTYAYAQASLLHYAEWMADHERPYFDQVEKLEYPTEVWAAQELRKANVFRLAAAHAGEPLRSRLLRKGEEFSEQAWKDLYRFPSRTVARTAAIILVEGLRDHSFRHEDVPRLAGKLQEWDFGAPRTFIPQKQRVKAQLKSARGLAWALLKFALPGTWWLAARLLWKHR